jgi:hypothetical protein
MEPGGSQSPMRNRYRPAHLKPITQRVQWTKSDENPQGINFRRNAVRHACGLSSLRSGRDGVWPALSEKRGVAGDRVTGRVACRGGPLLTASGGLSSPVPREVGCGQPASDRGRGMAWQVPVLQLLIERNCHSERGPMRRRRGGENACRPPRNPAAATASRSRATQPEATPTRAAKRAPTAVPRDGGRTRDEAGPYRRPGFDSGIARCAARGSWRGGRWSGERASRNAR